MAQTQKRIQQEMAGIQNSLQPLNSTHPLYYTWRGMRSRCNDPTHKNYPNYGGRGIKVCDRWLHSFQNFRTDMGDKPTPNHTLDRINNDEGYSPDNCRWQTRKEQAHNRKNSMWDNGKTLQQIAEENDIPYGTLKVRYNKGLRGDELLKYKRKKRN